MLDNALIHCKYQMSIMSYYSKYPVLHNYWIIKYSRRLLHLVQVILQFMAAQNVIFGYTENRDYSELNLTT